MTPAGVLPPDGAPARIDLGPGEAVLLRLHPHWIYILLDRPGVLLASLAAGGGGWWLGHAWAAGLPVLWLGWQWLERASRVYVLTDRRVVMIAGVLRQAVVDAPLSSVRQVSVFRSIPERLLDLGTVAFATAGTAGQDLVWRVIDRPTERLRLARETLDAARAGSAA
jgi:hypothetical protein